MNCGHHNFFVSPGRPSTAADQRVPDVLAAAAGANALQRTRPNDDVIRREQHRQRHLVSTL